MALEWISGTFQFVQILAEQLNKKDHLEFPCATEKPRGEAQLAGCYNLYLGAPQNLMHS